MRVLSDFHQTQRHARKGAAWSLVAMLVPLCLASPGRPSDASQGANHQFRAPTELWGWTSDTEIVDVILLSDGGAVLGTWCCAEDKKPGANTVYRIRPDGQVAWRFTEGGRRVGLNHASPDGRLVLVTSNPEDDPEQMKLLILDQDAKVLRSSQHASSAWLWLSPDGKFLLRWDNPTRNLILEESISGKRVWSLDQADPAIKPVDVDYINPVLQAGYFLIWDSKRETLNAVDTSGRHKWSIAGLRGGGRLYPVSPAVWDASGRWLAVHIGVGDCRSSVACQVMGEPESAPLPPDLQDLGDTVALIHVPESELHPGLPREPYIVWQRVIRTTLPAFLDPRGDVTRCPPGGLVLGVDLFQTSEGPKGPTLTILTRSGVTTVEFDERGWVERERLWSIPNAPTTREVWVLPSGRLLVRQYTGPRGVLKVLLIVDETGTILWELRPEKEILSINFDPQRRYMLVQFLREVQAFRLN